MDLLCIDFTNIEPNKNRNENVLIMTDAFSEFSVAVITTHQTAKTVTKALVNRW